MKYRIACDLETGGLDPNEVDALSIFMGIVDENDTILEELDLLLKPDGNRLPIAHAAALKVTGIDLQKHLEDPRTITYSEANEKIVELLKRYREKGRYSNLLFAGFNCDFDLKFIWKYIVDFKVWDKLVHYKNVDTMEAVDFLKRMGWLPPSVGNLGSCVEYFQLPKGKAHNAREDILMTLSVDKKIKELMNSKKNGGQEIDLITLLESE